MPLGSILLICASIQTGILTKIKMICTILHYMYLKVLPGLREAAGRDNEGPWAEALAEADRTCPDDLGLPLDAPL